MRRIVILVSICCIGAMLGVFKCGTDVTAIVYSETSSTERAPQWGTSNYASNNNDTQRLWKVFEDMDTASWEGYGKPKTVKFNELKGARLQGLDFTLDKCLHEKYGFELINPERPRYGLFEFDDVERMSLQPVDTVYAIIAAPGYTPSYNGPKWSPRHYMFWNRRDTVFKDRYKGPLTRLRRESIGKRRINGENLMYTLGALRDLLSTKLHGADSLDALPPRYWAPLEDMEGDPNKYITFAIKMIFKNGVVTKAWVTKFYNGSIEIVRRTS